MRPLIKNQKGFTLVEMLFAIFSGLILIGAVYIAIQSGLRSSSSIERKVSAQQDVRAALDIMAMEIGMASYNPTLSTGLWLNSGDCASAGTAANKGIQLATPTILVIEMDINGNGNPTNPDGDGVLNDSNEIIRYEYRTDAGNQYITRMVSCGVAQPFLGESAASSNPRAVNVINTALNINNGNGVPAVFRYYDGNNNELYPDAANPAPIPNIRRIDITLAVETDQIDEITYQRRRMIYSTSVVPRNHAITQ